MYSSLFLRLKELGIAIDLYMCDFELAQRKGIKTAYEHVTVKGCLFHMYQALIKHMKKEWNQCHQNRYVILQNCHMGI